jgi:hypothetical protein
MAKQNSEDPEALVFISHDSRDVAIAEAFAKLVKNATAGMVGSFTLPRFPMALVGMMRLSSTSLTPQMSYAF